MGSLKSISCISALCLIAVASFSVSAQPAIKPINLDATFSGGKAKIAPVEAKKKWFGTGPDAHIQINGFMSLGLSATNAENNAKFSIPGHGQVKNSIGFLQNSLVGLQLTGNFTRQLAAVLQVVATGEDINGEQPYYPVIDWAFLRYKLDNSWQFRIGRMRLPDNLYAQTEEIGFTYIPIFLPPEVYRLIPFYEFNGADLTYSQAFGASGWVMKLNPFFGENTSKFDLYTNNLPIARFGGGTIPNGITAKFDENYIYGMAADLVDQSFTFHASYIHTNLSMNLPAFNTTGAGGVAISVPAQKRVVNNQPADFYNVSGKMDYHHYIAVAEYAHRDTPVGIASLSGYYGLIGYRLYDFLPYVMYAKMWTATLTNIRAPGAEAAEAQQTYTLGANYYINKYLVAKLSASLITPLDGTNGLFTVNPILRHVLLYAASLDLAF